MNVHQLGVLKGLIQAFLAVHKGGALAKGSTTSPSGSLPNAEIIQSLVAEVGSEILAQIDSFVGTVPASATTASVAPAATVSPATHS